MKPPGGSAVKCTVKLVLGENEIIIGPGTISLLEMIQASTSVLEAASDMDISYSKAWKLIRQAEKSLGKTLVSRKSGGPGGGKAEITPDGKALIKAFRKTEKQVQAFAEKAAERNFKN